MGKKRGKVERAEAASQESRLQKYMINANLVLRLFVTVITVIVMLAIIGFFIGIISPQELARGNVAVIPVHGVITAEADGGSFSTGGTSASDTVEAIKQADEDPLIKAMIFEINSPGGAPVASDEITQQIKKVNKTTVAVIRDIGASGAYWIASAADRIYANEISITGSIGVIGSYIEIAQLLEEYNVTYRRIVSGKYKDMGSPLKEMTGEEQLIFQRTVDKMRDYFVKTVAENRNMKIEDVDLLATGAFYLGSEALEKGLVDEIGGMPEAIEFLEDKHNITAEIVEFWTRPSLFERIAGALNVNSFFVGKGIGTALAESPKQVNVWA